MLIKGKFLVVRLGCNLVPRVLFPGSRLFRLAKPAIFLYLEKAGLTSPTYYSTKTDGCSTLYRFLPLSGWMRCVCGPSTTHQIGFKLFENKWMELGLLERSYIWLIQILFCPKLILYPDLPQPKRKEIDLIFTMKSQYQISLKLANWLNCLGKKGMFATRFKKSERKAEKKTFPNEELSWPHAPTSNT